jgi:molecular chaperone Hsp33
VVGDDGRRNYAAPVRELLGELAAVTAHDRQQPEDAGRLSFQLQGHGPVSMLVMDCNEKLHLRGMAKSELDADADAHINAPPTCSATAAWC